MAVSFSISDITADVATRANVPAFTTSTNTTSGKVAYWIAQAARSLSAILQAQHCEDADLVTTDTLTTTANLDMVSLPPNCSDVHAIVWHKDTQDYRLLKPASLDDLENTSDATSAWAIPPRYRLEGNLVRFIPASTQAETLTIFYTSHLVTTGETAVQSRLDADLWITLDVAIKVVSSKGRDPSALMAEKANIEAAIKANARRRDAYGPKTIRAVRNRGLLVNRRWDKSFY